MDELNAPHPIPPHERQFRRWMLGLIAGLVLLAAAFWAMVLWPLQ
jgi:hypothetical protein